MDDLMNTSVATRMNESQVYIVSEYSSGTSKRIGISLINSLYKPKLMKDAEDRLVLLDSWIKKKTQVIIRWPQDSTSSWNLDKYDKPVECDYRQAILLFYSDDKNAAGMKRDEIIKERKSMLVDNPYPKARRSLNFQSDKTAEKRPLNNGDTEVNHSSEEEINALRAKIRRLEEERAEAGAQRNIIVTLETKVISLEKQLDRMAKELGERENQNMTLSEQIKQLKNQHPIAITADLQKNFATSIKETIILSIKDAMKSISQASPILSPPGTPSTSNALQDLGNQLVPLGKQQIGSPQPMMVNAAALRRAITAGRMGSAQPQVNSCVRELLSGFFSDAELAKLSLSGRKCPTKPDGKAKEKLPENIKLSITEFVIDRWRVWHGTKLDRRSVNSAFTSRFGGAHTNQRKQGAKPTSTVDDPDENIFLDGPARKKGGENLNTEDSFEFDFNEVHEDDDEGGCCARVINTNEY